ncbi:MAG: hypothetical protein QGI13_03485 [Rhodospirillales bacterium]|jgi:hypothetical protein|nr:hypothetical protein [Rhodospirillales bacterium]
MDDKVSRSDIAALVKWAGMELSEAQFDQLCEAYPHAEHMIESLPRDRPRWDELANVFEFPPEDAER